MIALGLRHAKDFAAAAQHLELVRPEVMLLDFVVAGFAQMRAGGCDDRYIAQFAGAKSGVHDAVVGKRADVNDVGVDVAQGLR